VFVDVHILASHELSISEGHYVSAQVHRQLHGEIQSITDVTIHVDTEDDESSEHTKALPERSQIEPVLHERWKALPGSDAIKKVMLHYIEGKLYIDIYMPISQASDSRHVNDLVQQYNAALNDLAYIAQVKIFFEALNS